MIWMDVDAALAEVPVNTVPLTDDGDFKSIEESVAYNATGLELIWHFVTTAGAYSATVVTPTTGGSYDWAHQDGGMYTIEIPASGGASINNDTEGFGYFTGKATGVLPWRGPTIGFRAAGLNNLLIDDAHSATRGLAGTALPNAAADGAGGLPISDAGGLDLDAVGAAVTSGTHGNAALKTLIDAVDNFVDTEIASLQSDVTAILADTNELQGGWAVVYDGVNGWLNVNTFYIAGQTAQAEITARVQAALENNNLDHLVKSAVDTDFATTVHTNSVLGHLADNGAGFDRTTDSLEAVRDSMATAVNLALVAVNVNSVLTDTDELQQAWADGGRLDLILDARASQSSVDTLAGYVDTEVAAILAAVDTEVAALVSAIGTPSNLGSGASLAANLADIEAQTDDIGAAGAGLTAIPWNASWDAEVQSEVTDALTTALAESYRAHGATGSVAQLLYELIAHHGAATNSGTNKQTKRLDGATNAKSYTYNSASNPTSVTHAS